MAKIELKFSVDLESPIAVYVQIENQIQFAIASEKIKPGETLPSVRDMSEMLKINPNTVTKSYRDLELLQLVTTRRGVGVSVTEKAPKLCKTRVTALVKSHLKDSVSECLAAGFSAAEVRKMVAEVIESGALPYQG